ncbi:hypothetical protein [Deinococcus sp.]|uniref:hypothetical protein n=1 Tax=Deinococcus sp. TaxID=47478 RepID=UPI0025F52F42|nr:hypothetical protein [Deinococcus sp.]
MSLRLALLLSLTSALAAPAFEGEAHPVIPPTRCAQVLPKPTRDASGYHYGSVLAAQPLRVASCWKGTLRGKPFTLTGYGNGNAETAVTINMGERLSALALGAIGSPTVIGFTGSTVCFLPSMAKGIVEAVDLARPSQRPDAERLCQGERIISAPVNRRLMVSGLKAHYPIGLGVIRTY